MSTKTPSKKGDLPFLHRLLSFLILHDDNAVAPDIKNSSHITLAQYEKYLLNQQAKVKVNSAAPLVPPYADILQSGCFRLVLSVKCCANGNVLVSYERIDKDAKMHFVDREIVDLNLPLRLISVSLSYETGSKFETLATLAAQGFNFLDFPCVFFASKDPDTSRAFFVLCEDCHICPISTVENLRRRFGNFHELDNICLSGLRLGLLVSGTCEGLRLTNNEVNIHMIDDVIDARGKCLTDGSGFISLDLAMLMPQVVLQGTAHVSTSISRITAAAFQVRVFCSLGVFKGTLVVRSDLTNTVQLRPSMLKVARSSSSSVIGNDGIKSENKELQVIIEIVNTSRAPRYSCSSLNHHLLLVLSALGVPTDLFQRHLRNQTQQLSTMATTRHGIVQYFRSTESYRSSSSCEEVESDKTRQMILSMVFAGHEMKDPYLQCLIRSIRDKDLEDLLHLRIKVSPSAYLMGIPDPYGLLRPGEVYLPASIGIPPGEAILITRFPLLRTSSMLIQHVMEDSERRERLEQQLYNCEGLIIFSAISDLSLPSAVDSMGGDFDGDLYFVCGQKDIVDAVLKRKGFSISQQNDTTHISMNARYHHPDSPNSIDFDDEVPCVVSSIIPLSEAFKQTVQIDTYANDNRIIDLLTTKPSKLDIESFTAALFFEFVYSISPVKFISTFMKNKLGYSTTKSLTYVIPSKENVGKWSNIWFSIADKKGISDASDLADLHDLSLQSRKYPPFKTYRDIQPNLSIDEKSNLPTDLPHYLKKGVSRSFDSSSVLGQLFNECKVLCYQISPSLSLSDENYESKQKALLDDLFNSFRFSLDSDLRVRTSSDYIQLSQRLFDSYVSERGRVAAISSGCTSDIGGMMHVTSRLFSITLHFRRIFHELVITLSTRLVRPLPQVAWALASALYEVSYIAASQALDSLSRQRREKTTSYSTAATSSQSTSLGAANAGYASKDGKVDSSKICKFMIKSLQVPWLLSANILNIIKNDCIARRKVGVSLSKTLDGAASDSCSKVTADSLLCGIDENKLQPSVSFTFVPPPSAPPSVVSSKSMSMQQHQTVTSCKKDKLGALLLMEYSNGLSGNTIDELIFRAS